MNFCLEEKLDAIKKPIVKNKLSWNVGIYKDSGAKDPEIDLNMNKNTEIKLITVVVIVSAVVFVACMCRKMSKMFR